MILKSSTRPGTMVHVMLVQFVIFEIFENQKALLSICLVYISVVAYEVCDRVHILYSDMMNIVLNTHDGWYSMP